MFTLFETTASGASFTSSTIPGFHKNLRLVVRSRSTAAVLNANLLLRFNADAGANYDWHQVQGNTGAGQFGNALAATSMQIGVVPGSTAPANLFSTAVVDIIDYANFGATVFEKIISSVSSHKDGIATNANLSIGTYMGAWRNTGVITSLTVLLSTGNLATGTTVALYGYGS